MPQNAIIRADGTGDYTTIIAWEAGEQASNYGSPAVGRVDGFFDQGAVALIITGGFANGARLEAFDSSIAFDGTKRQLCGLTATQANRSIRCRQSISIEFEGLEIYSTGTASAGVIQCDNFGPVTATNCLVNASNNKIASNLITAGSVLVSENLSNTADPFTNTNTLNTSSVFANSTDDIGQSATITASDTVSVNTGTGSDFDASDTLSNTASTDGTADTLTNIVIADNFVNSDPLGSGDYRIKSGSDLDTNGIGAFIQSSGGQIDAAVTEVLNSFEDTVTASISINVSSNVTESLNTFEDSSSANVTPGINVDIDVTETLSTFNDLSQVTITEAGQVSATITETLNTFEDNSIANISANIGAIVTESLNSFSDSVNAIIQKEVEAQVTEQLNAFSDSATIRLPINITINPKNVVRVARKQKTTRVLRRQNTVRVR